MSGKLYFVEKLEKSRAWQIVFFVTIEVLILVFYLLCGKWVKIEGQKETAKRQNAVVDFDFFNELEEVSVKAGRIVFSGWAFYKEAKNEELYVVLRATDGSLEYVLPGSLSDREGIVEYYALEKDSGEIGFVASIYEDELDKKKCYEILLSIVSERKNGKEFVEISKKVSTGCYFYDRELYRYNPEMFVKPEVFDGRVEQVIEKGILRAYDLKEGIWIYQQEGTLYYVVDSRQVQVCEEMNVGVVAMPRTSRVGLLPEKRQKDGKDNLGTFYPDDSYNIEEVFPYQIITVDLPTEYPLTYISTGLYNSETKTWIRNFLISMYDWRMYEGK